MNEIRTPYSDLVAGTVTAFDAASDAVTTRHAAPSL